jgi:hypothetical protein
MSSNTVGVSHVKLTELSLLALEAQHVCDFQVFLLSTKLVKLNLSCY